MEWEDDERAYSSIRYCNSKQQEVQYYEPVYKIMKQYYDEEKESILIHVCKQNRNNIAVTMVEVTPPVEQIAAVVVEEPIEEPVEVESDTVEVESDIVNSVLENKINNKFCYY